MCKEFDGGGFAGLGSTRITSVDIRYSYQDANSRLQCYSYTNLL